MHVFFLMDPDGSLRYNNRVTAFWWEPTEALDWRETHEYAKDSKLVTVRVCRESSLGKVCNSCDDCGFAKPDASDAIYGAEVATGELAERLARRYGRDMESCEEINDLADMEIIAPMSGSEALKELYDSERDGEEEFRQRRKWGEK